MDPSKSKNKLSNFVVHVASANYGSIIEEASNSIGLGCSALPSRITAMPKSKRHRYRPTCEIWLNDQQYSQKLKSNIFFPDFETFPQSQNHGKVLWYVRRKFKDYREAEAYYLMRSMVPVPFEGKSIGGNGNQTKVFIGNAPSTLVGLQSGTCHAIWLVIWWLGYIHWWLVSRNSCFCGFNKMPHIFSAAWTMSG